MSAVRERSCTGKIRHTSARFAQDAAEALRKEGVKLLMWYRCPFCGGYHVGKYSQTDPNERHVNKQQRRKFFEGG